MNGALFKGKCTLLAKVGEPTMIFTLKRLLVDKLKFFVQVYSFLVVGLFTVHVRHFETITPCPLVSESSREAASVIK